MARAIEVEILRASVARALCAWPIPELLKANSTPPSVSTDVTFTETQPLSSGSVCLALSPIVEIPVAECRFCRLPFLYLPTKGLLFIRVLQTSYETD
jgi:hypothetical protein